MWPVPSAGEGGRLEASSVSPQSAPGERQLVGWEALHQARQHQTVQRRGAQPLPHPLAAACTAVLGPLGRVGGALGAATGSVEATGVGR